MDRKTALTEYIKKEILRNPNAKLGENQDLLADGILDSLAILQLIAYISEAFKIEIPDQDVVYENFISINALTTYLSQYK